MVDVFDRHEVRFDPRLAGCSRFVRYSDFANLSAENERLKQRIADYQRDTSTVDAHETVNVSDKPEGQPEPVVDTEPWGYWVKHKYAEGGLVRTPCFIPEESHYTEVLPLYTTLSTHNDELEREVKRLRDVNQWQPIETAPKDGTEIIARRSRRFIAFSCWWQDGEWLHYDHDDGLISYRPNEWMPFPAALSTSPQGGEHGE